MVIAHNKRLNHTVKDMAVWHLNRRSVRPVLRYIAGFWILGLILGSLLPFRIKVAIGTTSHFHRPLHMFAFGSVTFLLLLISRNRYEKVAVCLLAVVIAVVIEVLELRLTYHPRFSLFEWRDLFDDSYGIATAAALFALFDRVAKRS